MPIKVIIGKEPTQEDSAVGYVQWERNPFTNRVYDGRTQANLITKITLNPEGDFGPQIELSGPYSYKGMGDKLNSFKQRLENKGIKHKMVKNEQTEYFNIVIPWDTFKEVFRDVPDLEFAEDLNVGWLDAKEKPLRLSELFAEKIRAASIKEDFDKILQLAINIRNQQYVLKKHYLELGQEFETNAVYVLATAVLREKGQNDFFRQVYMDAIMWDSRFKNQRSFLKEFMEKPDYNNNPDFLKLLLDEVSKRAEKDPTAKDLQREVRLMVLSMDPKANAQKKYLEELFGMNKPTESTQEGAQPEHKDAQANVARKEAKGIQLKASDPRIKQAMENARELSQQNKDAWWVLGEFLKENHLYYEAVQAFVNIPKDHPEYSNAQLECAHIYSQQWELIAAKDPKFQGLEEKENNKIKILEDGLRFAARANEPDIASMIYFQLIGKEFEPGKQAMMFERFAVPINAANVDAVIEGARIARETQNAMQAQIAKQKKQIQDLQGQLARVENKAAVGAIAERGIVGTQPLPSTAGQQGPAQPVPSAEPPKPKQ